MATISNTPRPGYVWDSTDNVWYPIGVGGHSHGEIPATIVDAKGDLIVATAADTVSRLAVGNSGEQIVADSSATTGLRYQGSMAAGKNAIINGGMDIWQRGTASLVPTGSSYLNADRYYLTGTSGAVTFTQQTDVPTAQYFSYSLGMSTTATNGASFGQRIEAANSVNLAGKTVTFSVYAKGVSGTTNLFVNFYYPTAKDNYASVTQIGSSNELSSNPSSSWTRYSVTVTMPSNIQNGLLVLVGRGTGACSTYITGLQIEVGSVATNFTMAGGNIQGELAACQRYYFRITPPTVSYHRFGMGQCSGTTTAQVVTPFPVSMRTEPTALEQNGVGSNYALTSATAGAVNCSAVPTFDLATTLCGVSTFTVASGLVAGNATQGMKTSGAIGYLGWSAEL